MEIAIMTARAAKARDGTKAVRRARVQFAPGAVHRVVMRSMGTPPVTSANVAKNDGQAPTSLTRPVASRTNVGGFLVKTPTGQLLPL